MAVRYVPPEVSDLIAKKSLVLHRPEKIRHLYKKNGEPCSLGPDKDPCLTVTKRLRNIVYFCHRCKEFGVVKYDASEPSSVVELIHNMRRNFNDNKVVSLEDIKKENQTLTLYDSPPWAVLPDDFKFINAYVTPEAAKHWFENVNLRIWRLSQNYDIGYSLKLDRVIIPLYGYIRNPEGDIVGKKFLGWTGRCPRQYDKDYRKTMKRPKFFTEKVDKECERLFFTAPRKISYSPISPVVIVEDILSAIKVNHVTGNESIALLCTDLPYSILSNYRDAPIIIWLDHDARTKTIQYVKRFNSLGFKVQGIYTKLDPKMYDSKFIRENVNEAIAEACTP